MIRVDYSSRVPVYQQIVEEIRLQIARGGLRPGDRLDPVRQLAGHLHLNASTVARAYQVLEHEGVIQTNRRGGSVIAGGQSAEVMRPLREGRLRGIVEHALVEALAQGYHPDEVQAAFELQLAVWRERRRQPYEAPPERHETVRLTHFAGSHDLAFEVLLAEARRADPAAGFSASYVGSLDGLLALLHREVGLAGAHILDEESGEYNLPILQRLFPGGGLCVMTLVEREQGLLVAAGNPLGIHGLADLARPHVRFINRQPGSGTRTLLDYRLRMAGVEAEAIDGYRSAAGTHLAVGAAVAEGRADAGLGLFAAARAYGLGFIPIAHERFDLILYAKDRHVPPLAVLLDAVAAPGFRSLVAELGGYATTHTGEETYL